MKKESAVDVQAVLEEMKSKPGEWIFVEEVHYSVIPVWWSDLVHPGGHEAKLVSHEDDDNRDVYVRYNAPTD